MPYANKAVNIGDTQFFFPTTLTDEQEGSLGVVSCRHIVHLYCAKYTNNSKLNEGP